MPRLASLTSRELLAKLGNLGFKQARTTGSHVFVVHPDGRRAPVPWHNRELPRGTLMGIVRQLRLKERELQFA